MSAAASSLAAIGFLAAVEHAELGVCGGYLILNAAARPLEFHCTAPVQTNRAQEILYGPTLKDYLYEQIAPALLAKGKTEVFLVCVDSPRMLAAAAASAPPIARILDGRSEESSDVLTMTLGQNAVGLPRQRAGEWNQVARRWESAGAEQFDLAEPFARIREALEEAQRAARPAA